MRVALRSLLVCVLGAVPVFALGGGASGASPGVGSGASLADGSFVSSLVPPHLQWPSAESEPSRVRERRQSTSLATVQMSVRSRTMFAHLGAVRAAQVARGAFPVEIGHQVDSGPLVPVGGRIVRYSSDKVAQLELPGGKLAAVESLRPMAVETSHGHHEPVDLGLIKAGNLYESARPVVGVLIPSRLREGVVLPEAGVSLTPVNAQGTALVGSEGQLDGASVLYANTQTDTDTAVKPTIGGVETNSILRSLASPEQLYFRVGLPSGGTLEQGHDAGGPVQAMSHGREIALIRAPTASDAEGTSVPVSMSVQGDMLKLNVAASAGEYHWPIAVDPEVVTDNELGPAECYRGREGETEHKSSNWCVYAGKAGEKGEIESKEIGPSRFIHRWGSGSLVQYNAEYLSPGEYTVAVYHTQGQSKIYELQAETVGEVKGGRAKLELAKKVAESNNEEGEVEHSTLIKENGYWGWTTSHVCAEEPGCGDTAGAQGNIAAFKLEAAEPGASLEAEQGNTYVYIAQEKGPEVGFNETASEIEVEKGVKRLNALYGGGAWLGPYADTAFEVKAHDPGVGIAWARVGLGSGFNLYEPIYEDGKCNGVQCKEEYHTAVTYSSGMAEGEQSITWVAADLAGRISKCPSCLGMSTTEYHSVKVDARPPSKLEVSGWPASHEISATSHTLTVSATDEETYVGKHSSGVKSITVSLDGGPASTISGASCSPGTCTASGTYALNAEDLAEGVHRLVVVATDNANNVSPAKEFTFDVRHGSSVTVGPGTVDPTTGQFKLSATDVSLTGAGNVSRVYESRNLTAGIEGPLGPQWSLSLGGSEGLSVLPTGSVVLSSAGGGTTTFTLNSKGEFESPKGDENLQIEYKAAERKYVLKDTKAGSETVFEQPTGTQSTPPTYGGAFGAETGVLSRPVDDALDGSGNVWVTDWSDNRVAEFTGKGALVGAYGVEGSGSDEFHLPFGVAVNQTTGNVYVSDYGNSRIDELSSSGSFIRAFGWGVSNGEASLQSCLSSCRAGIAGAGAGQLSEPLGVAIDSSGNVWVAEEGNDRIQEFSETGASITTFGSVGTGAGQFEVPMNIAFVGGDVYVTDQNNNRVDEFSTSGTFLKTIGWGVSNGEAKLETCTSSCRAGIAGTGNGQFDNPRAMAVEPVSGNLYVADMSNNRVQAITTSGAFVSKFGSGGSGPGQFSAPMGLVVSPTGTIYVTDFYNARVQEWSHAVWWPTSAKGSLPDHTTYTYTSVENNEGITSVQPFEVIAPTPQGVECGTTLEELKAEKDKGCRALTFEYAKKTKENIGENQTEWGEYKGHLSQIMFHAWNTSTKSMEETAVAQYSYDKQGRLRAEWDPRIEKSTACGGSCSALKTTYGYDAEGHVTSLTPAKQESWAFTYGTIPGDASTGRLLKVMRAPASAALWNGEVVKNTEVPKLSGTAVVGVKMGASHGVWSNSPVAYGYQWEDCNSEGKSCTPILGATNENYKIASSDVGHTLVAQVIAINGGGGMTATSTASAVVATSGTKTEGTSYSSEPGSTIEYHVPLSGSESSDLQNLTKEKVEEWGQKDAHEYEDNDPVEGMAVFPPDEPQGWPASDYERATIDYMNAKGLTVNTASPTGGISTAEYNEINETVRTLTADNRAAALKEGCKSVSKKECRSAEVSEKLDTRTEYSPNGSDIVKVLGSEHKIKLADGEEVGARAVSHDYYDEDAQQAEEKNHETYNLLTRSTSGALLASGEEKDIRTTITSYGGQKDLGWKLRKPTSVATDPAGLDLVRTTVYNETTGDVVETKAPGGSVESVYPPTFSVALGSTEGSGSGQFNHPLGVAVDSSGDLWVDDNGNHRIQEFSSSGTLIRTYGSEGSGEGQLKDASGIAIDPTTGNVIVSDTGNNRIDVFSSTGKWVRTFGTAGSGNGQLKEPDGLTVDSYGNVWIADMGNNRIEEFSSSGTYESQFGKHGSGNGEFIEPVGVAISEGEFFVADRGNDRIEEFTPGGEYREKFGSVGAGTGEIKQPEGIGVDPMSGNIYVSDFGNERIDEFTPAGKPLAEFGEYGTNIGGLHGPTGITLNGTGKIYIADEYNAKIDEWLLPEVGGKRMSYSSEFGEEGSGEGRFNSPVEAAIDGSGDVWITDHNNDRVEKFSATGQFLASYGSKGSGNGQFNGPTGIDINKSSGNVYIVDSGNNRIEELSSTGTFVRAFGTAGSESGELNDPWGVKIDPAGNVWVADTKNNRVQEFSATGTFIAAYGSVGTGNAQFKEPEDIAFSGGNMYVTDSGNNRVQELSMTGSYIRQFGSEGDYDGQFEKPEGIAVDSAGNVYVVDTGNNRIQEFTPSGAFLATFGSYGHGEGQLSDPGGIAINAAGDVYVIDSGNNRSEIWMPVDQAAHDTQTIYYSAKEESSVTTCRNHPEWAGLACQAEPAAQPDRGLPELPVSVVASYNIWDEAERTEEKFGTGSKAVTRTKIETYDPAGRAVTSEETASPATDTTLPKVTNEYNSMTGALETQSTSAGTITGKYNKLGQLTEYKDASGNVAKYSYEEGGDGRLLEVSEGKGEEAKSTETYTYSTTTGFMEKLIDTAAGMTVAQGTFTASYDVEGKMTSEIYPNGMCANTTYNSVGEATSLEYIKTRNCSETGAPVWFSDSILSSIHGETLQQTSTLAKESYAYDNAGRLLETQETPAGKGCVVRLYGYEEESNRTSETSREPGAEGKCATEGGTIEHHTYDEANRLTDTGVEYETFGNTTKMPAADAGKHEITSTYYVDNQLASETQNGETFKYAYDPSGRTIETIAEGTTSSKVISHYTGPGNALTWTSEGSEKWTRNIPGIDGALDAVQTGGGSIVLQLHDLQGNIVGTAGDSESETKMLTPYNSTEFGVPQPGTTPPKYAWLGAAGISTESSFGSGVATQSGASYVPQVARALQTAPIVPPGAFPDGQGTGSQDTSEIPGWYVSLSGQQSAATLAEWPAKQKAREKEAEEAMLQQCQAEGGCGVDIDPRCTLQLSVGDTISSTGKEWVYVRGWATCRGVNLPEGSVLEVCLEESNPWSPVGPSPLCNKVVAGEGAYTKPTDSLYAHQHVECGFEATYRGAAGFVMPGMSKPLTVIDIEGGCGLDGAEGLASMDASFIELFPGIFDYGG